MALHYPLGYMHHFSCVETCGCTAAVSVLSKCLFLKTPGLVASCDVTYYALYYYIYIIWLSLQYPYSPFKFVKVWLNYVHAYWTNLDQVAAVLLWDSNQSREIWLIVSPRWRARGLVIVREAYPTCFGGGTWQQRENTSFHSPNKSMLNLLMLQQ